MSNVEAESLRGRSHLGSPPSRPLSRPLTHILYNHALESIFAWLSLTELSAVMAVCQRWKHIVGVTMKRIDATFRTACIWTHPNPHPISLPLSRHIATIRMAGSMHTTVEARTLFERCPHLQSFRGFLRVSEPCVPIPFRTSLTQVDINLSDSVLNGGGGMASANAVLVGLSKLPRLRDIRLELPFFDEVLSLESLAEMTQLETLTIAWPYWPYNVVMANQRQRQFTRRFLDELRALVWLDSVNIAHITQCSHVMEYLFREPHSLRWKQCAFGSSDQRVLQAVRMLPHLTHVSFKQMISVPHGLGTPTNPIWAGQLPDLFRSLSHLTSLSLSYSFITTEQMPEFASLRLAIDGAYTFADSRLEFV